MKNDQRLPEQPERGTHLSVAVTVAIIVAALAIVAAIVGYRVASSRVTRHYSVDYGHTSCLHFAEISDLAASSHACPAGPLA